MYSNIFYRVATRFFKIFSRFLKVHILWSILSLKLSLRLKTMLNIIKTLKRYCKTILNVFKKIDDDKNFIYMTKFLCQIEILLLNI